MSKKKRNLRRKAEIRRVMAFYKKPWPFPAVGISMGSVVHDGTFASFIYNIIFQDGTKGYAVASNPKTLVTLKPTGNVLYTNLSD